MAQTFPLLTPPFESSYLFHHVTFPFRIDQFEDYFQSSNQANPMKQNDPNQYIQQHVNQIHSNKCYKTSVHENESSQMIQNVKFVQQDFEKQSESFFIQLVGTVPRVSFIRNLLLMIFPNGMKQLSMRKITRSPLKNLLRIIGENLHFIKSYFSEEIKHKWIQSCYEILKNAQRLQKNDLILFGFLKSHINTCRHCQEIVHNE
jgi:hypothetical protein